jgi:hypothetical protein
LEVQTRGPQHELARKASAADIRANAPGNPSWAAQVFSDRRTCGNPGRCGRSATERNGVGYAADDWLFPNTQPVPAASMVNFDTDEYAIANGGIVTLAGGQLCLNIWMVQ